MGLYINPKDDEDALSKAVKIAAVGDRVTPAVFASWPPGVNDTWGVVLLDNGIFVAAGVAYSTEEARVFADINDSRPKEFYLLSLEAIEKLDPRVAAALKGMK